VKEGFLIFPAISRTPAQSKAWELQIASNCN
jgi:hypothetical protein